MKKILFLTNGHGEDLIAAGLIKLLKENKPEIEISVMPLVGTGKIFEQFNLNIIGPRKNMPSGGFMNQNLVLALRDLWAGLIGNTISEIKLLRKLRGKFDLIFVVGDIFPLLGALLTKTPFIFYGCAKSDYYTKDLNMFTYMPWEKWLLKNYCLLTLTRDNKTAENLKKSGIKAEYLGNPMMDEIKITATNLGVDQNSIIIGILPGSRQDAYLNIEDCLGMTGEIEKQNPYPQKVEFLIALAPQLDRAKLPALPQNVKALQGCFGDILSRADIILGLSGTGNEQAVGLGKSVVTFGGRGIQHTLKFAKIKKQLLGEAVSLVERNPAAVAGEIWKILSDPERLKKIKQIGGERMGSSGASRRIVERIREYIK